MPYYDTSTIIPDQNGLFTTGNLNSNEVILIHGSCRVVPYINYLNFTHDNKYKIIYIRSYNQPTDQQNNSQLINILKSINIFIYEHCQNMGDLNTCPLQPQNIYKLGLSPQISIHIPQFNDLPILFNDYLTEPFLPTISHLIKSEHPSELSKDSIWKIHQDSQYNINKFIKNCHQTSFPEMAKFFSQNLFTTRLFCTYNHISSQYTLKIWEWINTKYLNIPNWNLPDLSLQLMFENTRTPLCKYDLIYRNYQWNEPIHPPGTSRLLCW